LRTACSVYGVVFTLIVFQIFGVAPLISAPDSPAAARPKPNVLFIAIDDLNDWVSCLGGHPDCKTPNIDRLAARGVLFSNAHCQAPICNPSRTSFMTGLRPSTTGIYMNSPWFRSTPANKDRVTLTQHFAAEGYKTFTTGKIYHGSRMDGPSFQVQGPRPGQRSRLDKIIRNDFRPGMTKLWDFGPQDFDEAKFNDFIDASWAIQQLQSKQDKPFFLAVGFYRPHVPFYAPTRLFKKLPLDSVDLPVVKDDDRDDLPDEARKVTANSTPPTHEWFSQNGRWRQAVQAYIAAVHFTDEQVGRLLDALDKSAYAKNTIIVLFSDHGFHLGEKQRWAKQSLWERSTRVPLIVSVPGGVKGERCTKPVELISLYPTLIELCGVAKRPELQGASIKPLLDDPKAEWKYPALTTYGQNNHSVRTEHYRYIQYNDGSQELYDHRKDPREWNNVAGDPAQKQLMAKLAKWLPRTNVPPARGTRKTKKKKKPKADN